MRAMPNLLHRARAALLLVACLAAAPLVRAQAECPAAPALTVERLQSLQATASDRGMLWRAEKDGRTSWLYGTVHLGRLEWLMPGPTVARALAASDVVAVELDITDPGVARAFARSDDAQVSRRLLDSPRRERIERLGRQACVPAAVLQALRPLMQVMTLALFDARFLGMHPEFAIDGMLIGFARSGGKRLVALETPEGQLAALAPASDEEELELVESSLQDMETGKGRAMLRRMAEVWAEGDEAALDSFAQWCDCMRTPAERRLYVRVNDERNLGLADKIAALHDGGARVFAGVGLLHMSGAQALPALLRARGFNVQRVPFRSRS